MYGSFYFFGRVTGLCYIAKLRVTGAPVCPVRCASIAPLLLALAPYFFSPFFSFLQIFSTLLNPERRLLLASRTTGIVPRSNCTHVARDSFV